MAISRRLKFRIGLTIIMLSVFLWVLNESLDKNQDACLLLHQDRLVLVAKQLLENPSDQVYFNDRDPEFPSYLLKFGAVGVGRGQRWPGAVRVTRRTGFTFSGFFIVVTPELFAQRNIPSSMRLRKVNDHIYIWID